MTIFGLMTNVVLSLLLQPGQSEFVPVTEVPPTDQLPAAPLLIAAYAFVWVAVLAYVWLLWRRIGRVEKEMQTLGVRLSGKRP